MNAEHEWTPGEFVTSSSRTSGMRIGQVKTVGKIHVTVAFGDQLVKYRLNGSAAGDFDSWGGRPRIEPTTQAHRDEIKRSRIGARMDRVRWRDMPLTVLVAVDALIPKETP